jgi:hypothetical protein
MDNKTRKSGAAKSLRTLPAKTLDAKTVKGVTGGFAAVEHGTSQVKRGASNGGGNVTGGWDLVGNKVHA